MEYLEYVVGAIINVIIQSIFVWIKAKVSIQLQKVLQEN